MASNQDIDIVARRLKKTSLNTKRVADINHGIAAMTISFKKVQKVVEEEKTNLRSFTLKEYMDLQCTMHELCSMDENRVQNADKLYTAYKAAFDAYLSSQALPVLREGCEYKFLKRLDHFWHRHCVMVRWLSSLVGYLDRSYLCRRHLPTLHDAAMARFRNCVYDRLKVQLVRAVLALVEREREGRAAVDASVVRAVAVTVFVAMGIGDLSRYEEDLEAAVLEESGKYYSREAGSWMEADSVPEYMVRVEEVLRRERERVASYLHPTTEPKMVEVVRREVLVGPAGRLLENEESGFVALLRADDLESVERVFRLYVEIPEQLKHLVELFEKNLTEDGMEVVRGESSQVIKKLISLHKRNEAQVTRCFHNHDSFQKALSDAFQAFSNAAVPGQSLVAELIAAFCKEVLENRERMSDDAVEDSLDHAAQLLVYAQYKDVFVQVHHKNLSDRLLSGQSKSKSQEHDRFFLGKLKQRVGDWCTQKFEGMLNDMSLVQDTDAAFAQYLSENGLSGCGPSLSVSVLTSHRWPVSHKLERLAVPADMARCIDSFTAFYATKFNSRKLSFFYSLGNCHVRVHFDAAPIDLLVSPYQASLLLLFNNNDALSYSDIKAELKVEHEPLLRAALHSLSCFKYDILLKKPRSNSISTDDVFEFHSNFRSKANRIKISLPKTAEDKAVEEKKTSFDMDMGRGYVIDAALVRIMKSRKILSYQELVIECVNLLRPRFIPDPKMLKARVESLIDRDYLQRDAENSQTLIYVA